MLNKSEIIEITIDALAHGGEGIGRIDGMTVFVPDTIPGDKVKAEVISVKKSYARALAVEILEPSASRVKPFCGLTKVCGGCQIQHIDYPEQLRLKKRIVEDSFKKIANLEIEVKDPIENTNNRGYRCKIQYPVQQTKVSRRYLVGYYQKGTHDIINVKHCEIQPSLIDEITEFLRTKAQELHIESYKEKKNTGLIRHFVFRYSKTNQNVLLTVVVNSKEIVNELEELCTAVKRRFKEIAGVLINFNTSKTNIIMSNETQLFWGKDYIEEEMDGKKFKISAGSFFQVNPEAAQKLFQTVKNIVETKVTKPTVLDVYSGVGTFTIWLQELASKITSIEENQSANKDAKENIVLNQNPEQAPINILEGNADNVLLELVENNEKFDVTVLDPPRKGCSKEALESIVKLTDKYIIYVSCDPATLARDVKLLNESGFTPEFIQPVDMFSHTYHIESIVVLKKQ